MRAEPRATVVVVNWNGERWLRPCLDALAHQSVTDFQTWVVDNASTDGSVALLEREYPHVRVLRNDRNRGFAGGNNTALREVTTPYAVLLNNDATPRGGLAGAAARALRRAGRRAPRGRHQQGRLRSALRPDVSAHQRLPRAR